MAHSEREKRHRHRSPCRNNLANTYYVDPQGNDYNPGTLAKPFKTIQHAIDVANVIYVNYTSKRSKNINISFGTYTETLSITCPVQLTGSTPTLYAQGSTCCITGDITVNITASIADVMHDTQVGIFNILVLGSITDSSTAKHTLVIKDAFINAAERCLYQNQTGLDCRTYLENVAITGNSTTATNPLLEIHSGVFEMTRCHFIAAGPQSVLKLSGTAKAFVIALSTFESTSVVAQVPAIVNIATPTSTAVTAFSDCVFTYTAITPKIPASTFNTGIYMLAASITMVNSVFNLIGTTNTGPSTGFVIDEPTSGGTGTVVFSNIVSYPGTAASIHIASKSSMLVVV